ncbi:nucleotide-sugar transporter-domain-containing protein [Aspergillus carlsbadensis]|nr:nucleotide-sugar transporter-domain-containing protein [Aspergillus carlsbadensis]
MAILLSEVIKLTIFALLALKQHTAVPDLSPSRSSWTTLSSSHKDAIIPAVLYTSATFLQSIGAYNLDLLPYLMLSQTKVIITPILGAILLNQRFTRAQWLCFILVSVGVILVQSSPTRNTPTSSSASNTQQTQILGAGCMLLSGFCVALAGILIEKMLQTSKMSFMVRNAQLAWYSCLAAALFYLWRSQPGPGPVDPLHGFNLLVWGFTLLQATGGFIVAWCVALTSTVVKNHAQVGGFVLASMEPLLSQGHINLQHLCGVAISVGALFEYARQRSKMGQITHRHSAEKDDTMV